VADDLPRPLIDAVLDLLGFLELAPDSLVVNGAAVAPFIAASRNIDDLTPQHQLAIAQRAADRAEADSDPMKRAWLAQFAEGLAERARGAATR
jgi:hypothetical protein